MMRIKIFERTLCNYNIENSDFLEKV